jgi:pyruvate/2-oxoacid:ferredoxin oxidoreductase alpha subunit
MIKQAYELSERFATPVMFRTTTRLAHTRGIVEPGERIEAPRRPFTRDARQYAIPVYARFRRPELEEKLRRLREFAEEFEGNVIEEGDPTIGVVSHGIPYQYVKEVAPEATVFKLGMLYPLPEKRLKEFCARFETVYVVEESEGFIQQERRPRRRRAQGNSRAGRLQQGCGGAPAPAQDVRRLSPLRYVRRAAQTPGPGDGRHRVLHAGLPAAALGHRHHFLHGRQHRQRDRFQEGG